MTEHEGFTKRFSIEFYLAVGGKMKTTVWSFVFHRRRLSAELKYNLYFAIKSIDVYVNAVYSYLDCHSAAGDN